LITEALATLLTSPEAYANGACILHQHMLQMIMK